MITAHTAEWIERMRSARVLDVAAELGHKVTPARGSSGGAVFGCPSCNAPKRHTKAGDKRGAVGLEPNGRGWRCFQCTEGGDALDFVAYALRGGKLAELGEAGKAEVRDWCRRWAGLDDGAPTTGTRPKPVAAATFVKKEPVYLAETEVRAVWSAGLRADEVPQVASWLASRRIDATRVADADLARVLPGKLDLPPWGGFEGKNGKPWRSWPSVGLSLVVPLYDQRGCMRSLIFRRPFETAESWPPKSVAARAERSGLAMACPLARQLIELGSWPDWWPEYALRKVLVGEGEPDFLTYVTEASEADETAPPVIAGISGSWGLLAHVPAGSVLVVQTHGDKEGAKYATEILDAVRERWRAGEIKVRLPPYFDITNGRVELRA